MSTTRAEIKGILELTQLPQVFQSLQKRAKDGRIPHRLVYRSRAKKRTQDHDQSVRNTSIFYIFDHEQAT